MLSVVKSSNKLEAVFVSKDTIRICFYKFFRFYIEYIIYKKVFMKNHAVCALLSAAVRLMGM